MTAVSPLPHLHLHLAGRLHINEEKEEEVVEKDTNRSIVAGP